MKFIKNLFTKPETSERELALNCIYQYFVAHDVKTHLKESCVLLFSQPEVHIAELDCWQHENNKSWLAHGVIQFRLNPERKDSWVVDCATGVGDTKGEAIRDFANNWSVFTAPTPLSLLLKEESHGATLLSPEDEDGFPGWEGFSGPFMLRGSDEQKAILEKFLREKPVLPRLSKILEPDFPAPMLVGIRIFWGNSNGKVDARVAINDVEHKVATEKLVEIMKNYQLEGEFYTISQFVLLLQKVHAENT